MSFLQARKEKLDAVVISGGEPCVQKGLVEFIRKIKDMGFPVKLDTNGSFPNKLQEIINLKLVDYIAMDIKAPLNKYKSIVNSDVNTDNISKSINIIKNSGIDYEFRTTVVKSQLSYDDFEEIGEMICGANKYFLQKFVPYKTLNKLYEIEETYTDEEFAEIKFVLEKEFKANCFIR